MKMSRPTVTVSTKRRPGRPPLDADDDTVQTGITLPAKLYAILCRRARREDVSVAEIIRRDLTEKKSKNP